MPTSTTRSARCRSDKLFVVFAGELWYNLTSSFLIYPNSNKKRKGHQKGPVLGVEIVQASGGPLVTDYQIPSGTVITPLVPDSTAVGDNYALSNGHYINFSIDTLGPSDGGEGNIWWPWDFLTSIEQPFADGKTVCTPFWTPTATPPTTSSSGTWPPSPSLTTTTASKLRDLGKALGFYVGWDNGVIIQSDKTYSE